MIDPVAPNAITSKKHDTTTRNVLALGRGAAAALRCAYFRKPLRKGCRHKDNRQAPGAVPGRLARLGGFPDSKICGVFFQVVIHLAAQFAQRRLVGADDPDDGDADAGKGSGDAHHRSGDGPSHQSAAESDLSGTVFLSFDKDI